MAQHSTVAEVAKNFDSITSSGIRQEFRRSNPPFGIPKLLASSATIISETLGEFRYDILASSATIILDAYGELRSEGQLPDLQLSFDLPDRVANRQSAANLHTGPTS